MKLRLLFGFFVASGATWACGSEAPAESSDVPSGSNVAPNVDPNATVAPSTTGTPGPSGVPATSLPPGNPSPSAPSVNPTPTTAPSSPSVPNDTSSSSPTNEPSPGSDTSPAATSSEPGVDTGGSCDVDACPFPNGLDNGCQQRFALGINYAWHDFGADFGGLAQWSMGGITANRATVSRELADMRAHGVSVVRWWMFPDFRGDGVTFDGQGDPTGLSATALLDIETALTLAAENDVYLVLTLFSFDNFRPTRIDSDVEVLGMTPMVRDATRRAKVIEHIVRPAARAAAGAPHAERLLGWDVINEPEWAVSPTGTNDQDFTPNDELDAVSLADMKALINESLAALAEETPRALRSVGWAAAKWAWAFEDVVDVDFHQPHIYGWVDQYWPYTQSPSQLGYTGKPTVMGEFYMLPMPFSDSGNNVPFGTIVGSWYENGYAGAWAWSYTDMNSGPENLPLIQAFAEGKGCEISF